ncbi:MAG: Na+/H+ antiporter NhaA [Clostridiales Family XIII bacterium]|jgi:NhaA family Na+:H+ antiporter|nr:Na+/H+ antiporter NhaA [Clostridiales Family XIII bacterium]
MSLKIREYSLPLIVGAVIALVWANISPGTYSAILHHVFFSLAGQEITVHFLVNDIFMCFFFAIAGIEIVNSLAPGGSLYPLKKATAPLLATLGGILGPIAVFFILNGIFGKSAYTPGWGICTATDIALSWMLARIVFGGNHPAVSFLLLLAVADDAAGLAIIAIFYPEIGAEPNYLWLLLVAAAIGISFAFKKFRVDRWWLYLLVPGLMAWVGMHNASLHPALSFVFVVPFLYRNKNHPDYLEYDEGWAFHPEAAGKPRPQWEPLLRCEKALAPIVDYGLIFFGLVNAGVEFSRVETLTWIVVISLVVGKTLGVTLLSSFARLIRLPLPEGMGFRETVCAGLVAGMGLTVALFVADSAFADPGLLSASKMGALFSVVVFLLAPIAGKALRIIKVSKK